MYTNDSNSGWNTENEHVINGVKCDVVSCVHNCKGCECTAGTIHVGTHSADCCSDTRCDTYQEK